MASTVYFADLRTRPTKNMLDKVGELLDKVELSQRIKKKGTVAKYLVKEVISSMQSEFRSGGIN